MASRATLAAKRRLSLDILAASKVTDGRLDSGSREVADFGNTGQNATTNDLHLKSKPLATGPRKLSLFAQKKQRPNGVSEDTSSKTVNGQIKPQKSEVQLTWSQRYLSWRYCMVILLQSSFVVAVFLRNCLPMAMVCMVKPRAPPSSQDGSHVSHNKTDDNDKMTSFGRHKLMMENASFLDNKTQWVDTTYEFDWNSEAQGLVLTSIMFSTFTGPLLVTFVKERLGSKITLTVSNFISAVLTFLSPIAARTSPYCLVAVRVLLGISLGGNVPVVGDCVAWWAPQEEKLTMISLTFTGVNIGGILASFLSGYLCLVPLDNGWPFVFYTFGTVSLIWNFLWYFLSSHKPEEHPFISEREKQYIISHRTGLDAVSTGKKIKPPYRKLMSSIPVLAFFATATCHVWSMNVLFTYLPVFINKFLRFSVQDTGVITSIIVAFRMFGSFFWTALGNKLVPLIGVNKSRKTCICIGFGLAGAATVTIGMFSESYKWVVMAMLLFVMVCQSVGSSTITALPLDMAPRFAGLLTGMFISIGSFVAISGPLLTAAITTNGTQEEWRIVWIIMGTMFIAAAAIFLPFGQAKMQPWAYGKDSGAPHVVSPFVTMGRRFSTFLEAPPLSPVLPRENGFDFSNFQAPASNVFAQLATASPDIFYVVGKFNTNKPENIEVIVESETEVDTSYTEEDAGNSNNGFQSEEITERKPDRVRKRAISESEIDVLKSNMREVITIEYLSEGRNPFFAKFSQNTREIDLSKEGPRESAVSGTINAAYSEEKQIPKTRDDEMSHL